ncbi:MAG TPA: hypothetical protein VLX92_32565 [Kofleriaceae bacterium]|nr:hypothetical protein [Kofleriaceae bacterium]
MRSGPFALVLLAGCSASAFDSAGQARKAAHGLERAIARSVQLAIDGYNAADSDSVPDQLAPGDAAGTLAITGAIDRGSPTTLRLYVGMAGYADGKISYDTGTDPSMQPYLQLAIRGGTFTGTLTGSYAMSGELTGDVTIDVELVGRATPSSSGALTRVPGATVASGTAITTNGMSDVHLVF